MRIFRQRYPVELMEKKYDPSFAIRGLHFDKRAGIIVQVLPLILLLILHATGTAVLGAAAVPAAVCAVALNSNAVVTGRS